MTNAALERKKKDIRIQKDHKRNSIYVKFMSNNKENDELKPPFWIVEIKGTIT